LQARLADSEARFGAFSPSKALVQSDLRVAKEKKKAGKESQKTLTKKLEKAESWRKRLKKRYQHYKSKAAWFFKQLSFLPWLRDQSWA